MSDQLPSPYTWEQAEKDMIAGNVAFARRPNGDVLARYRIANGIREIDFGFWWKDSRADEWPSLTWYRKPEDELTMTAPNFAKFCDICGKHVAEYHNHCEICGKAIARYHNYCSNTACMIELTKRAGGVAYTPNNLPIRCFRHDGLMLECEHGDHPDYLFPVDIEFIGEIDDAHREDFKQVSGKEEFTDEDVRHYMGDSHALLYANWAMAVTISETCSYAWHLLERKQFKEKEEVLVSVAGASVVEPTRFKISDASLAKIVEHVVKRQMKHDEYLDSLRKL